MYVATASSKSDVENSYSGILTELGLVQSKRNETLVIEGKKRPEIPAPIILYAILENEHYKKSLSISIDQLYNDIDSVGAIFAVNRDGLTEKLEKIQKLYPDIIFKNEAGIRELLSDKVIQRYERTMQILLPALKLAYRSYLFDNSGRETVKVAEKYTDGSIYLEQEITSRLIGYLLSSY